MRKKIISKKIQSKYILNSIFNYIKDVKYKMKLFLYSKSFQQNIGLKLSDYQSEYFKIIGFDFRKYLKYLDIDNNDNQNFDNNLLNQKLKEDLSKYNDNICILPEVIIQYFKDYKNEDNDNNTNAKINSKLEIDIYSPFFDLLSKNNEVFEKMSIVIPTKKFIKFKLNNDYISKFDELNKINSKYTSLNIYCKDNDDLIQLKDLKINFNQIKSLSINCEEKQINYDNFFNFLLSLNIKNNLIDFILNIEGYGEIEPKTFDKLNNFTSIENLSLIGLLFANKFNLKLNLKVLVIKKCENIIFDENISKNLKKLFLYDTNIFYYGYPNKLIKFPKVEECILINKCSEVSHYNEYIDFSGFENLKILKVEDSDFLSLEKTIHLEELTIFCHSFSKRSINFALSTFDRKIIKKIISIQSLKKVDFRLINIKEEDILEFEEKNNSIKAIKLYFSSYAEDVIIPLLNKFPKVSKLTLLNDSFFFKDDKPLEILENANLEIKKIKLKIGTSVKLFCGPYENLIKINIELLNKINNHRNILPIFNDKCNVIFQNLKYFRFIYHPIEGINKEVLNNIYNNIDNMPNLQYFELVCMTIDDNKELYEKLNKKMVSLNLDKFILSKEIIPEKDDNTA